MNKLNKILAVMMAGVMVVGSGVTAFADDINGATGAGTSTGHLDTSVVTAVLPTSSVDGTFAFTVDPEDILATAGKIKGSDAVTANDNKVYFANKAGGYSATSDAVPIGAKNYADAEVSVTVKAALSDEDKTANKTMMPLAATETELSSATVPTLLLTVTVGTGTGDATGNVVAGETGITVKKDIAGQPDNFDITYADGKYKLEPKSSVTDWDSVNVTLTGKVGGTYTSTEDTVAAPQVSLTWSVTHKATDAAPSIATTTYTMTSGQDVEITLNYGVGSLAATGVEKVTFVVNGETKTCSTDNYSVANGKLTFKGAYTSAMISNNVSSRAFTIVFNDTAKTSVTVTLAKE